jgi:hypothetical protein
MMCQSVVISVRIGMESIGRVGGGLLILTGLVGVALGVHGWSARHAGSVPASLASPGSGRPAAQTPAPAPHGPSAGPAASSSAGPTASRSATPSRSPGPLLKSMPYAAYAYQIYPGALSAQARQALAGLTVKIHKQGTQISMTAAVNGGQASKPSLFPATDHVYIVESALGDDATNTDYNLGDDGLVVTDAQGRIVR